MIKLKGIIYWLLSIIILLGSPDITLGGSTENDSELKVEEQQRKKKKKKKKKKTTKKKKKKKKTKKPAAAVPHFNNISKADFTSGKHKQLTIPYVDGGVQKYGVATYNSGRYVIMRDIGINADGATYDYWRGK